MEAEVVKFEGRNEQNLRKHRCLVFLDVLAGIVLYMLCMNLNLRLIHNG